VRVSPSIRNWLAGAKSDPSIRLRFLTEVEGRGEDDPQVSRARKSIGRNGWAASLLEYQQPDGHWFSRGTSPAELYNPKFVVTNWLAIVLADLGATRSDPRVRKTAELMLGWRAKVLAEGDGHLCVNGNSARTLIRFGYLDHPVVQRLIAVTLRTQKSDGGWHCFPSRTGTLDGWEGLAALAEIPEASRDAPTRRAVERGAEFFLGRALMNEGTGRYDPWFRIHYPNHYYYDVLVGLRLLTRLGYGSDRRLRPALRWLRSKRRPDGTWALDAIHPDEDFEGQTLPHPWYPMMLETIHERSQWATVEALSVLARVESG
jgi:hypothetical protein